VKATKRRRPRPSAPATAKIAPLVIQSDGTVSRNYGKEDRLFFQRWQPTTIVSLKDVEESWRISKAIDALPKQCWFNAREAIQRLEDYALASYVEGWAVDIGGVMLEHGWLLKDEKIVDPTLPDGIAAYFPGLEFKGRHDIEEFLGTPLGKACRKSPFFFAFGWGGGQSPTFRAAQDNAMAFVWRMCMLVCPHPTSSANRY
jgi:hypothetical protein